MYILYICIYVYIYIFIYIYIYIKCYAHYPSSSMSSGPSRSSFDLSCATELPESKTAAVCRLIY